MSGLKNSEKLRRRLNYWDRLNAILHDAYLEVEKLSNLDWADSKDMDTAYVMELTLRDLEVSALKRFHELLGERLDELQSEERRNSYEEA